MSPAGVFTIPADALCLAGHFPGAPIVPGVVLLERVAETVRSTYGGRVARILRCKFVAGLYPDERCEIELTPVAEARLRFRCHGPGGLLVDGVLEWGPAGDG